VVPRIIHQTWKNYDIPEKWKKNQETWKKNHPNWKYMYWTDEDNLNLIKNHYPWFLETFVSYPHNIQRADAIRPFILYHYGGIYADMDYICLKNFDDVVQKDGVYLVECNYQLTNSLMASSSRHPFWKIVMKNMMKNTKQPFYMPHHLYILTSTGPHLLNNSLKLYEGGGDIYVLDQDRFSPCSWCEKTCKTDNRKHYSYTDHNGTWTKWDTKVIIHFTCRKNYYLLLFLFLIILWQWRRKNV